jgi:hypothetical protein
LQTAYTATGGTYQAGAQEGDTSSWVYDKMSEIFQFTCSLLGSAPGGVLCSAIANQGGVYVEQAMMGDTTAQQMALLSDTMSAIASLVPVYGTKTVSDLIEDEGEKVTTQVADDAVRPWLRTLRLNNGL